VVNATDTSTAAAPATSPVSGEGVYGAMVADSGGFYVAVFSPTVRNSLSYTASHPGTAKHVVSGLNPGAYFVTQNGVSISDPYPTDASGAIAFAETGGGVIGIGGMGVSTRSLPAGMIGTAYHQSLAALGGTGQYLWSIASGTLPPGLSLSSGGAIGGTPSGNAGTSSFVVQALDLDGTTAAGSLSIVICDPLVITTSGQLPGAIVGIPYAVNLEVTGGNGGNAWNIVSGALPAGLSMSAVGAITGSPTTPLAGAFTVAVTDALGATASKAMSVLVLPAPGPPAPVRAGSLVKPGSTAR
jgi:hypothetical protein